MESKDSWCEEHVDLQNICDGTKEDCIRKAGLLCKDDSSCLGFMWNQYWGPSNKGVKKCTSTTLTAKPAKDWEIYFEKCHTGIDSIEILDQELRLIDYAMQ